MTISFSGGRGRSSGGCFGRPTCTKPAIFSKTTGGTQYAAFTDGGYYDTIGATGWGNNTTTHYLMGVKIDTSATATLTGSVGTRSAGPCGL